MEEESEEVDEAPEDFDSKEVTEAEFNDIADTVVQIREVDELQQQGNIIRVVLKDGTETILQYRTLEMAKEIAEYYTEIIDSIKEGLI